MRQLKLASTDPRLKRHINHDPRSRDYAFPTTGLTLQSVQHQRYVPIFDQGDLGSCTGNAGVGCLATGVFYLGKQPGDRYSLDEPGAVQLYSDATAVDPYPGQYPPDDTGSDGLTIAKVLKAAGEIAGYQHTFTLDDALKALTVMPFITGTSWFQDMFNPDPDGRVHPNGAPAGGHEYVADELDVTNDRIWFQNSWGPTWGVNGRFYLTFEDYGVLLAQQGDVTIFVPRTVPAPTPTPPAPPGPPTPIGPVVVDDADRALAEELRSWANGHHVLSNARAAMAVRQWMQAKGL
jgi:hypothetical protein